MTKDKKIDRLIQLLQAVIDKLDANMKAEDIKQHILLQAFLISVGR